MSSIEVVLGFLTVGIGIFTGYMALRLKPIEDKIENINDRIKALHDDAKDDREKVERRLNDIERSYVSRTELTTLIRDIREGLDKSADRVEQVVRALGNKVDHLADRLGKVEGAS